eukprot:816648-Rhodomonas_salina.4
MPAIYLLTHPLSAETTATPCPAACLRASYAPDTRCEVLTLASAGNGPLRSRRFGLIPGDLAAYAPAMQCPVCIQRFVLRSSPRTRLCNTQSSWYLARGLL